MSKTLVTAPAYFYFFFGTPDEVIVRPGDQMDEASLTFTEIINDQMTQASQARADATVGGMNVEATISIANVGEMDLFARIFQGADDLSEAETRLIGVASRPGCPVKKGPCLIRLADCDGPTDDSDFWFYLPWAAFFTTDTAFNFSNQNQMSYSITLAGFDPPVANTFYPYKALRGDIRLIDPTIVIPEETIGGGTPATFDTVLTQDAPGPVANVTMVGADAGTEFRFNAIAGVSGTAISMDLFVAGTQRAAINTLSGYNGQPFRFLYSGTLYQGAFANGTVNVTAV